MFAAPVSPVIGLPQISLSGSSPTPDTTARLQPGTIMAAIDPWWGAGEFIYARANGTIPVLALVSFLPVFNSTLNSFRYDAVVCANTANLAQMVGVSQNALTVGQYGWFQISGITPCSGTASVAADTSIGIVAAGQAGAVAAGKQLLNARCVQAATATVVKANGFGVSGDTKIQVPNTDGWFVGGYLSGTGVGAATIISAIDPNQRTVTVTVANSAAVSGNITCTYNNATIYYNVLHLNRPFAQGAIT